MTKVHFSFKKVVIPVLATVFLAVFAITFPSLFAQMGSGGMGGPRGGMGSGNLAGMPVGTMMGSSMGGMVLMSGGPAYRPDGTLVRMDDAVDIATRYLQRMGTAASALGLDEVEEWEFNFYVVVKEQSPSTYKAFQLIIDKWTGAVLPEPGPNMMWNQKYAGMMWRPFYGREGVTGNLLPGTIPMVVSPEAANTTAIDFLRQRFPAVALTLSTSADKFYGYYNFDVNGPSGKYGMLSVNGMTGQVWYHTWHGNFIQGREL